MKQQINLYQPALFEKKVPFSALTMAAVLGAALLMVFAAVAFGMWRHAALESELAHLRQRQTEALQTVAEYRRRYPAKTADAELARRVERMMRDRQARLALLELLTRKQPGNSRGFSSNLDGLAREDLNTVWLRHIRLSAGGRELLLEGSTTHAADVPLYLQRLTRQQDYAGREFERLQLSRSEGDGRVIDFLLQTTQEEQP